MKKIKAAILQFLSGIEMLIRKSLITEPVGETVELNYGTGPRIMSSVGPTEPSDFNSWANHVHKEIQARYK